MLTLVTLGQACTSVASIMRVDLCSRWTQRDVTGVGISRAYLPLCGGCATQIDLTYSSYLQNSRQFRIFSVRARVFGEVWEYGCSFSSTLLARYLPTIAMQSQFTQWSECL